MPTREFPGRTLLSDVLDTEVLRAAIQHKHVRRNVHPVFPLHIYTYTEAAVYAEAWTDVARLCRGLVVDYETDEIIAWPFPKFFNHSEHVNGKPHAGPLPEDEPFEVYDKIDGSLGIVFWYCGAWRVATKGSFTSEQARWAQDWLDSRATLPLYQSVTYLVEIVYPENRIVVKYGDRDQGLVLLGAYAEDGTELPLDFAGQSWRLIGGSVVPRRSMSSVAELARWAAENRSADGAAVSGADSEGYVVRYASGLRVKIKFANYMRLHGIITRTSPRTVWEALSSGTDPADLLDTVPDEFREWVTQTADEMRAQQRAWSLNAHTAFETASVYSVDRKAFAMAVQSSPYRAALFRLLDGKEIESLAWKAVRPESTEPAFFSTPDAH